MLVNYVKGSKKFLRTLEGKVQIFRKTYLDEDGITEVFVFLRVHPRSTEIASVDYLSN